MYIGLAFKTAGPALPNPERMYFKFGIKSTATHENISEFKLYNTLKWNITECENNSKLKTYQLQNEDSFN